MSTLPGKGRSTCTRLFLPPAPSESSAEPEVVRQLFGRPSSTSRLGRGRADLGHSGPLALRAALRLLGQKGLAHSLAFSPLSSARGPCSLGCCSVETAAFSTCPAIRPQQRHRSRGKALSGRFRGPGISAHTASSLPLHRTVPLEAKKIWAKKAKVRGRAVFCL